MKIRRMYPNYSEAAQIMAEFVVEKQRRSLRYWNVPFEQLKYTGFLAFAWRIVFEASRRNPLKGPQFASCKDGRPACH